MINQLDKGTGLCYNKYMEATNTGGAKMKEMAEFVLEVFGANMGSSEIVALWNIATGEDDSDKAMDFLKSYGYDLEEIF